MNNKLSVVIPVYNEINTIEQVLAKVASLPYVKEIIAVDDGSKDGTQQLLTNKYNNDLKVKFVLMKENGGKGVALREGFKHITAEYVVVQDADLEYDPNDLGKMLQVAIEKNADVVYGNRFEGEKMFENWKKMDWKNALGNKVVLPTLVNILYGQHIHDEATCYKMFKTSVLKSINLVCTRFEFCPEVTAKVSKKGYKIIEVPISYFPRSVKGGKKLNALKDGLEAIWTLVKYRFT